MADFKDEVMPLGGVNEQGDFDYVSIDSKGRIKGITSAGVEFTFDEIIERLKKVEDALADYELLHLPTEK